MIWGGTRLHDQYGFNTPFETTGEAWVVSAHPNGDCLIDGGRYCGSTLSELFASHRELFGSIKTEQFPLLIKLIDARDNLSVQVHPDDDYAKNFEKGSGKTECWLVLDCEPDSEIIIGHDFQSRVEFAQAIAQGDVHAHLNRFAIKPGDFFFIPAGTVHAICAGTLIYEIQQNSDLTYRIDDYGRKDAMGKCRPLHIDQGLAVTRFPHEEPEISIQVRCEASAIRTNLLDNSFFSIEHLECFGETTIRLKGSFAVLGCLKGSLTVNGLSMNLGDHVLAMDVSSELHVSGHGTVIISTPNSVLR
jgi:mannose-6-phosphate isomerase